MSAIIMSLEEARTTKNSKLMQADLNTLINEAARNLKNPHNELPEGVAIVSLSQSREFITSKLQEVVIHNKKISEAVAVCAMYIGEVMHRAISSVPESLYAVDYLLKGLEEKDGRTLCEGGDLCFMYCTVFNERCHWRQMSEKGFNEIGQALYHAGYSKTGRAVHYQMSVHFTEMTEITKEALANL